MYYIIFTSYYKYGETQMDIVYGEGAFINYVEKYYSGFEFEWNKTPQEAIDFGMEIIQEQKGWGIVNIVIVENIVNKYTF